MTGSFGTAKPGRARQRPAAALGIGMPGERVVPAVGSSVAVLIGFKWHPSTCVELWMACKDAFRVDASEN